MKVRKTFKCYMLDSGLMDLDMRATVNFVLTTEALYLDRIPDPVTAAIVSNNVKVNI